MDDKLDIAYLHSYIFQGHLVSTKDSVTIKVPRVPDYIRKEKKEVKLHIEEAKKLLSTPLRKAKHENIVKYLNVSYDDFRKEIWVVGISMKCQTDSVNVSTLL